MNGGANTLIEYQPWCPVCDTVALNKKCLSEGASCMSSTFMYVPFGSYHVEEILSFPFQSSVYHMCYLGPHRPLVLAIVSEKALSLLTGHTI